jgi:hypothetical protein
MRRALGWASVVSIVLACGGKTDLNPVGGESFSKDELDAAILDEIDSLNVCTSVSDCHHVDYPTCRSTFTGRQGDHSRLDTLLAEYARRQGTIACDDSCECGTLRCERGQCLARSESCSGTRVDEIQVCL